MEDWLDKEDISPTPPRLSTPVEDEDAIQIRSRGKVERRPVSISSFNFNAVSAESKQLPASPTTVPSTWKSVSFSDLPPAPQPSLARNSSPVKSPVHLLLSKDAIVIVEKKEPSLAGTVEPQKIASASPLSPTLPSSTHLKTRRTLPATNAGKEDLPRRRIEPIGIESRERKVPQDFRDLSELPAPDTVKQVKRLFESGTSRKPSTRRSQSAGPGLNRVPLSAANQSADKLNVQRMNQANLTSVKSTTVATRKQSEISTPKPNDFFLSNAKPVIIAKPSPIGPKPAVMSPKPTNIPPPSSSVSGSRLLPNKVTKSSVSSQSPRTASSSPKLITPTPASTSTSLPAHVPISVALTKNEFSDSDEEDHGVKTISKAALDNIRSESTSIQFNFDDKKDNKTQLNLSKQVGIIRPQVKPTLSEKQLIDHLAPKPSIIPRQEPSVLEEGKSKSTETTFDSQILPKVQTYVEASPIVEPIPMVVASTVSKASLPTTTTTHEPSVSIPTQPTIVKKVDTTLTAVTVKLITTSPIVNSTNNALPGLSKSVPSGNGAREAKKAWHQQPETQVVFNFVNENKKVDHIRNEGGSSGILLYKVNYYFLRGCC